MCACKFLHGAAFGCALDLLTIFICLNNNTKKVLSDIPKMFFKMKFILFSYFMCAALL